MPLKSFDSQFALDRAHRGLPLVRGSLSASFFSLDIAHRGLPEVGAMLVQNPHETESLDINDSVEFVRIIEFRESLDINDEGSTALVIVAREAIDINDSVEFTRTLEVGEPIEINDYLVSDAHEEEHDEPIDINDRTEIIIDEIVQFALKINIDQVIEKTDALTVTALPFLAPPVSSLDDPDNPFLPTIAVDGEYLTNNPETQPSEGVTNSSTYVNFANPGIGDAALCGLYNYNINLTLGGGTFSFLSEEPIADLGATLTIFGMQGVVTETGPHYSSSGVGYITAGIFGNRAMNKQVLLTLHESAIAAMAPDARLQSPPSSAWTTVKSAALALADAAGVDLMWATHDAPLTDLFPQTGQTVRDALMGLAARVSGILCYTGNFYVVVDPQKGYGGTFSLPDCHLLAPGGIEVRKILDMDTSILLFPVETMASSAVLLGNRASFDMADASSLLFPPRPSKVETFGSMRSKLESSQPDQHFDLPGAYDEIKAQFLVSDPSKVSASPIATTDKDTWFDNPFPDSIHEADSGKQQLRLTSTHFPSGLDEGDFTLNLGYTRDESALRTIYDEGVEKRLQERRLILEAQQESIRYFPTKQGTVNCLFFGQVPYPGSRGGANFESAQINGLIESVSINSPGYMNVTIREYSKTTFLSPRAQMDYYFATGEPRPPGV
jgi:hypothetical protein